MSPGRLGSDKPQRVVDEDAVELDLRVGDLRDERPGRGVHAQPGRVRRDARDTEAILAVDLADTGDDE